ncbi:nuclear transport factor 2 family protein [Terrarubrum flagellatum]|uniref:nuclear transport factor 2 family protein n=1 Tax=Terrirubrum flagellatum TaxID=2895980 RepID=UPI003144D677
MSEPLFGLAESDLRDVAARDALRRLVESYSRAVDRRDFVLLESLYHPGAIEEHGDMFRGSPAEYAVWVQSALARYEATAHYVVNALFVIDGDRAEGEVYKLNYHRTHRPDATEVITGSRSLDRYEKRAGRWGFTRRSITLDWATRRPADLGAYSDFAAGSPHGQPGASDLSYRLLSLFQRRDGADAKIEETS